MQVSNSDVGRLAAVLDKPLRPIWLSQGSRMWLNAPEDQQHLPFIPLYLVSASKPLPQRQSMGELLGCCAAQKAYSKYQCVILQCCKAGLAGLLRSRSSLCALSLPAKVDPGGSQQANGVALCFARVAC